MSDRSLSDCTGYRVVRGDGRVGTVAALLPLAYGQAGGLLIVRDSLDSRLAAVSIEEVEDVDVQQRRLVLRPE